MEIKKGIGVSRGIAIREAFILDSEDFRIPRRFIEAEEADREVERFEKAQEAAVAEIRALQKRSAEALGPEAAQIFRAHEAMLSDKALREEVTRRIRTNKFTAEYAVSRALRKYIKFFKSLPDAYFAQRAGDIYDIEKRLLRNLLGELREQIKSLAGEVVLVAKDLTPTETATLDEAKVVAFVTDAGGPTSHTAILARALGIPAVVGLGAITTEVSGGDVVVVDGTKGLVIIDPDEATLKKYRTRQQQYVEFERSLEELVELPAETLDGHRIHLHANIEFPEEIEGAIAHGAEGIGLYRTEFLYTDENPEPNEEDHFKAYRRAVEALGGRSIVIRTLDLGGDKFQPELASSEKNPFLGCRSIRFCLLRVDLFKAQLRAIFRAAAFGPVRLMLPMITTLAEVRQAKLVIEDVKEDLRAEKAAHDPKIPVGIMVEVPSAALIADFLAKEVDFFSIGTNDLVQYALAVDRGNERVAALYQPAHPAVLRLVARVIEAAERAGIGVSMCGEMSGEAMYTIPLVGMGLRDLSISPSAIPEVKKVIRSISLREALEDARKIFTFDEARLTDAYLREKAKKIVPELF